MDGPKSKPVPVAEINDPESVKFYWIGHATILCKIKDKWIITDPNFSDRIGIIVKRYVEPGIDIDKIPKLDWILISHTHFDHLDQPSLRKLKSSAILSVPKGGGTYIPDALFDDVREVNPWDVYEKNGIKVTAVPARHFGGRWLIDNFWDGDPYTGYVIEYKGVTVFFAGDTGYHEEYFKEIGRKFNIDMAFIPVGPSRGPQNPVHVNPDEAMRIFADTKARFMIPIHHGTFYRAGEEEQDRIKKAIDKSGASEKTFFLSIGESVQLESDKVTKILPEDSFAKK
ncbi:MAG: MBL fold metallo-hydrolase [Leptospira sp.]|nr:MBL fold metallo-hydrolase [Leptospira sp.]